MLESALMSTERSLNRLARRQHGVFLTDQALRVGVGREALRTRVQTGRLIRLHPGVFAFAGSKLSFEGHVHAALLAAGGEACASHVAAARLIGFGELPAHIELTVPWPQDPRLPRSIKVHRARRLPDEDVTTRDGIRVTTAERTLLDLAADLDRDALERALDDALVRKRVTRAALIAVIGRSGSGRRGTSALRALLDARPDGHARIESPLEQKLHRLLERSGITGWTPNLRVTLPCGRRARIDVAFAAARLAVETDGYRWHASASDWANDHERRNALMAAGWRVLALTARTIDEEPARAVRVIRGALTLTAARLPS